MKKALSVLLVAAAIFGFYGSAVSVNDILACKDYWEEAGEKSTADMNKLEDGLNQLKENEQAYLDGKDQLAEGEQALADGEAQYEQGLKDYAEAPGKLAAGERKLAAGEKSYSDLKKLIKGLREARKHGVSSNKDHDKWWHDAYTEALKPNREKMESLLLADSMQGTLGLVDQLNGNEPGTIAGRFSNKGQSYAKFDKAVVQTSKDFKNAATVLKNYQKALFNFVTLADDLKEAYTAYVTSEDPTSETSPEYAAYAKAKKTFEMTAAGFCDKENGYGNLNAQLPAIAGDLGPTVTTLFNLLENVASKDAMSVNAQWGNVPVAFAIGAQLDGYKPQVSALFSKYINMLDKENKKDVTKAGYSQQFAAWDEGYQTLADGKDQLASTSEGVPYAFKNMVTNPTIKAAIKKYDPKLMKELKKYKGSRLNNKEFGDDFDEDLEKLAKKIIPRALNVLKHVKSSAEDQLADGRAQLAQGRADYAAAPGKLAEAEQMLADGRQQLEDGKAQLAQYEDGEQQVRDGLAQLVGTEPDLELESIADRLNGDTDFDNGDEHLDIDEGLSAVDVGRGYQADDGVLITNEIMARAVGTAGLLAAGVLAVIAAILSFLKKNKGAGVFALLAAAAGAFGAVYGTQAGTYFSSIAGSTVGATGWIAAGILGGVALIHAIVHFAAPKSV